MENSAKYFESNFRDDFNLKLFDLTDGKLRTEDGHMFPIHKYNLAKSSKYFSQLFCGMEGKENNILIPGIRGEDLRNILTYLYTGNIHVTEENICNLMIASDRLLLDDLLSRIKPFLNRNLTVTNSVSIFKTALQINRDDFSREIFRFVQTHFENLVYGDNSEISELPLDALKFLFGDKNLCVTSERTVWLAVITWVEADTLNRLSCVPDLLTYLTVSGIDENLASEILEHEIVVKNAYCQEIHYLKSRLNNVDNLKILQHYAQTHAKPTFSLYDRRQPAKLHYVVSNRKYNDTRGIQVYLTYDENIDLWRRILEIDLRPIYLLALNDCIYMFEINESRNMCYNVVEDRWNEMRDFITPRFGYRVVELNGLVYVLGGNSLALDDEIYDTECYDTETDEWRKTMPMIPVSSFSAVAHKNFIYAIGSREIDLEPSEMIAQVYDPSSETWEILPPPVLNRTYFEMVAYRDMIYVIGGRDDEYQVTKSVEVFDPIKNEWSAEVDMPYSYRFLKAVVINDKLFVFPVIHTNCKCRNEIIQWNSYNKNWEYLEESSPLHGNLQMYNFFTLENSDSITRISRENKYPTIHFEKSPFV